MEGLRATAEVLYSRYHRSPDMGKKSGYDRFAPATNGSGAKYLIPDMVLLLLAE
jgi:hypothetical protein